MSEKVVRKHSFGAFILGFLLGFIFLFVAVAGVGFYAYKKVSINQIEKTTKIEIPVYDHLKNKPLEKVISLAVDLAKDKEDLTLNKIEETFGFVVSSTGNSIPLGVKRESSKFVYAYTPGELDETYLDISIFSSTKLSDLTSTAKDFVNNLSLVDLQKIGEFTLPDVPLINDVKTQPLMDALTEISNTLNFDNLTLRDLKTEFDIDLTSISYLNAFLDIPFNSDDDNNLVSAFNNASVSDFVGLTKLESESKIEYQYRLQKAGTIGVIAKFKITELESNINNLTLGDVMGLNRKIINEGNDYYLESDTAYNERLANAKLLGAETIRNAKLDSLQSAIESLNIPNQKLSQLKAWGLVDYDDADASIIENKTITEIINAYIDAHN